MRTPARTTNASPLPSSRRALLPAARRVLWTLLRARVSWPRHALRERLRAFLCGACHGGLLRLVRETALAAAVATLSYLFGGGALPDPGPTVCGVDPTTNDALGCEQPPEDCE